MPPMRPFSQGLINVLLLDGFFQSFLLGTVVVQGFQYWSDCKGDSYRKRIFVATVVFFSILQTMLEDYKVFRTLAFRRRWSTSALQWSDFFLNGFICSMCQAFYINRCWILTEKRRWILVPLLALLVVTAFANIALAVVIGIAFSGRSSATNDLLNVSRNLLPSTISAFTLWMSGTLALDVCITVTVAIALWRSRTGSLHSDRVIHRIIMVTWESAALPSILTIVSAALYRAVAYTYDHVVILLVLQTGKLYTIGMLRSLNLRGELGHKLRSVDLGGRTSLRSWNWDTTSLANTSITRNPFPSMELCGEQRIELAPDPLDNTIRWSRHTSLDVVETQLPNDLELNAGPPLPTRQRSAGTRSRVTSGRSSVDM